MKSRSLARGTGPFLLLNVLAACSHSGDSGPSPEREGQLPTDLQVEEENPEDIDFGDGGDGDVSSGDGDAALGEGDAASGPLLSPGSGGGFGLGGMGGEGTLGPMEPAEPVYVEPDPIALPEPGTYPDLTAGMFDDNRSFDFFRIYQESIHASFDGLMPFHLDADYLPARLKYEEEQRAHKRLDISIVLDTTGSMGDEIAYLQGEFFDIADEIASKYPEAEQRWSLVAYRDYGQEEYLVNPMDFTDSLEAFQDKLLRQRANGGGDFPEAPEAGLAESLSLGWREEDDVAKMIYWVADAPHHAEHASALAAAVTSAQEQNVHIYPVGASGVDELTEFTMRATAQLTWGRYLFLTDDSGLGGAHKEPTLPCYYVTTLTDAILRGVEAEMTGEYREPSAAEIVRKEGTFTREGVCGYGQRSETLAY